MKIQSRIAIVSLCLTLVVGMTSCNGSKKAVASSSGTSSTATSAISGASSSGASKAASSSVSGNTAANGSSGGGSAGGTGISTKPVGGKPNVSSDFIKSLKGLKVTINDPWAEPEAGNPIRDREVAIDSAVEKAYGVTITRKPMSTEAIAAAITAGNKSNVGQIVRFQDQEFANIYASNVFSTLNSAIKTAGVNMNAKWYDSAANKFFTINGQQVAWTGGAIDPTVIFYNKRLLQLANFTKSSDDPDALYKSGQWTFDKLDQYATAGKKTSGTTVTTWGLESYEAIALMNCFVLGNGGRIVTMSNGKPALSFSDSKTKTGMDWFSRMMAQEKTAYVPGSWDQPFKDFVNGKTMMLVSGNNIFNTINSSGMKDAIGVVPFPKGPNASNYTVAYSNMYPQYIPKLYQNDAAKYLFIMDQITQRSYNYWETDFKNSYDSILKGDSYNIYHDLALDLLHGHKSVMDYVCVSGAKYIQGAFLPDGKETSLKQLVSDIATGTLTPSASVSKYSSAIQTQLNSKWKSIQSAA